MLSEWQITKLGEVSSLELNDQELISGEQRLRLDVNDVLNTELMPSLMGFEVNQASSQIYRYFTRDVTEANLREDPDLKRFINELDALVNTELKKNIDKFKLTGFFVRQFAKIFFKKLTSSNEDPEKKAYRSYFFGYCALRICFLQFAPETDLLTRYKFFRNNFSDWWKIELSQISQSQQVEAKSGFSILLGEIESYNVSPLCQTERYDIQGMFLQHLCSLLNVNLPHAGRYGRDRSIIRQKDFIRTFLKHLKRALSGGTGG